MGADIHVVLEKKFGDKWIGIRELESTIYFEQDEATKEWKQKYHWCRASSRNYELFGKLAGVRRDGPAPKGIPEDASELSRALFEQWDGDGHSHSYCSAAEYLQLLIASQLDTPEILLVGGPQVETPYQFYLGMYEPEDDEEYRMVFCFDN